MRDKKSKIYIMDEMKKPFLGKRILYLTLNKKWFDMIKSGEKKEEYRDIEPYWENRLCIFERGNRIGNMTHIKFNGYRKFDIVCFRNGYSKKSPTVWIECKGIREGRSKLKWGGDGRNCFIIKLGKILKKENC